MKKKIYLKKATARNFKGLENVSFEFTERETSLVGANGTGKSSFFAMFIWCLFGKDQFGRTDHQIKTLIDGKTDRYKEVEVELTLDINGEEKMLKRVYSENWVRPKGRSEDEFKGNETKRYINDVEVKASEYDRYVYDICPEEIFRAITNPSYFPNLKQDDQRSILFKMVGDISNESIAKGNIDFEEFLNVLNGQSFESFKKEVAAQKRRIVSEAESIPARIDELKRSFPNPTDWDALEAEIDEKNVELRNVESQLLDASKISELDAQIRLDIRNQINELEVVNQKISFSLKREQNDSIEALKSEIRQLHIKEGERNRDFNTKKSRLEYLNTRKSFLEEELKELINNWKQINSETLIFKDGEFDCPTCKRPLDVDDIEEKQSRMKEDFNRVKAEKLNTNSAAGASRKSELDLVNKEIKEIGELSKEDTSDIENEIQKLKLKIEEIDKPVDLTNHAGYNENKEKIADLKLKLNNEKKYDNSELEQQKNSIADELKRLNAELAKKEIIERTQNRIIELEDLRKRLNQQIADLERKEFIQKSFEYAKNEAYEKRINDMFSLVRFNLFRTQVDGQVVPTCEAHVDGVPYSTQNNAMQIGMGLDIINTISMYEGYYAPIFIDNRESVTHIPEIGSQIINLVVDPTEKNLKIAENLTY